MLILHIILLVCEKPFGLIYHFDTVFKYRQAFPPIVQAAKLTFVLTYWIWYRLLKYVFSCFFVIYLRLWITEDFRFVENTLLSPKLWMIDFRIWSWITQIKEWDLNVYTANEKLKQFTKSQDADGMQGLTLLHMIQLETLP